MSRKRFTFGIDNLEDRQLMAADLGAAELVQAPTIEQVEVAPAENDFSIKAELTGRSSNRNSSNSRSFEISPTIGVNDDYSLIINGTIYNDNVVVEDLNNGYIRVRATTTNDFGVQLGSKTIYLQQATFADMYAMMNWGDDTFDNRASRKAATVYGGPGDDVLKSASRSNLYGLAGNDELWGSDFADYLHGGPDDDVMHGFGGEDTLDGSSGNDIMFGGDQDDTMDGGSGDDTMLGQRGNDTMFGGIGNDKMDGGRGSDTMDGGDNNDQLFGRTGQDIIDGGAGNDLLDGGDDGIKDFLKGGTGADKFVRHKHFWSADDPDQFIDVTSVDTVFNDWFSPNYGNDFPDESDYF